MHKGDAAVQESCRDRAVSTAAVWPSRVVLCMVKGRERWESFLKLMWAPLICYKAAQTNGSCPC